MLELGLRVTAIARGVGERGGILVADRLGECGLVELRCNRLEIEVRAELAANVVRELHGGGRVRQVHDRDRPNDRRG